MNELSLILQEEEKRDDVFFNKKTVKSNIVYGSYEDLQRERKRTIFRMVAIALAAGAVIAALCIAWFVSNNKVTAQTTQIKAQSNTAFMSIEYKKTAVGTTTTNGAKKGDYIPVGDAVKAVTAHYAIGEASNYNISSAGVDLTNLVMNIIILQDR